MSYFKNLAIIAKHVVFVLLMVACFSVMTAETADEELPSVRVPAVDIGKDSLPVRKAAQLQTVGKFKVFYDFQFMDRISESAITFKHKIVDDAGKNYKLVHYDHGNGLAVADVDGDGLYDVYFISQLGGNELWKNLGKDKFQNITESAGVAVKDKVCVTASFADIDNDGDQDLYVTTVRMGNVLFENDGKGHFKDISKESGLDYVGHSSGSVFFDYNGDGLLDLFLANVGVYTTNEKGRGGYYVGFTDGFSGHLHPERTEYSVLFKNQGKKHFANVSRSVGLMDGGWSGDASFTDFNNDNWPDIYVLNMQGDDHYYENVKGEKFIEKTSSYFPKTPWGSMGIKFFDYNNDGLMDLLITDMHSDMSQEVGPDREKLKSEMKWPEEVLQGSENNIFGNAFYKNLGNGTFQEISDQIGVEDYWPWGVSVDDINADGYDDVLITASMNFPFRYGINSALLNNKGESFLDSEFILGIEPRKDLRTDTVWFELDCAGEDKGHKMCGKQTTHFIVRATLGTRSSAMFDIDNDGDLDIITNEFNSEPQVLISNLSEKKNIHFLKVQLIGKKSNRNALGATVKVFVGSSTQTKYNDGKSGYLSQSALPLYFGLADSKAVEKVEVKWPNGKTQVVSNPAVNTVLQIQEE
jgi:hypothetical protein